jgi:hypothetical protein
MERLRVCLLETSEKGRGDVRPGRCGAGCQGTGHEDLTLLAVRAASWPELLSSRSFELNGDPFLALRFALLFQLPVELEPV